MESRIDGTLMRSSVGWNRGTQRATITTDSTPMGTLMKNTHCQVAYWVMRPPSSGPASVEIPAVAPQMPSAAPRLSRGKMRLITLMVWGVNKDPPIPCTARAAISVSMLPASPQASDESVKIVIPAI